MKKAQYVVLLGMQLLHNNLSLKGGDPVELTDAEAEPLLGKVVALPEDANAMLLDNGQDDDTVALEELLQRKQLQLDELADSNTALQEANTSLQEQIATLQADVSAKVKALATAEENRLQAETAAKAAAEAQIAAEAEVTRLQAEADAKDKTEATASKKK